MERFFNKVLKTKTCWNWTGGLRSGYGAFKFEGKVQGAHRVSWKMRNGDIPEGLIICHKCDNRKCVNPDHLFAGTYSDNMQDCKNKGRLVTNEGKKFQKGCYPKRNPVKLSKALKVKSAIENRGDKSLKIISEEFNVKHQFVKDISAGRILQNRQAIN